MALMEGLDVFIGLTAIYLMSSLIVTVVGEGISASSRLKGRV